MMPALRNISMVFCMLLSIYPGGRAQTQETDDYYRLWLERDVLYIVSPEEKAVFKQLATSAEKEQFIEQFWRRRDSRPETEENEFKVEHYRRIAYVNESFAAGIPGWKTDRGRTYIIFGPPDEIESHTGGSYSRRIEEGGGGTSVFPFERWYYRHIPGLGANIELEFVDDTGGSLYRLAVDEHTKDALFYTPNAGLTLAEGIGLVGKSARLLNRFVSNPQRRGFGAEFQSDPIKPYSSQNAPFERLYRVFDLQKPPRQEFRDLRTDVFATVNYQQLPFSFSAHVTYMHAEGALVPITVEIDPERLTFTERNGMRQAQVSIYAKIESMDRRVVREFARDLELDPPVRGPAHLAAFQSNVPLRPGLYKVTLLVKDTVSGKTGVQIHSLRVPALEGDRPGMSSVMLARTLGPAGPEDTVLDPFVLGALKVHVNPTGGFLRNEPVGLYAELYNSELALGTASLDLLVVDEAGLTRLTASHLNRELGRIGSRLYLAKELRLAHLSPGRYQLRLQLKDDSGNLLAGAHTDLTLH